MGETLPSQQNVPPNWLFSEWVGEAGGGRAGGLHHYTQCHTQNSKCEEKEL